MSEIVWIPVIIGTFLSYKWIKSCIKFRVLLRRYEITKHEYECYEAAGCQLNAKAASRRLIAIYRELETYT